MDIKKIPDKGNGFIYILSNSAFPHLYKVGFTSQNINARIKDLNSTGVPSKFKVEYLFEIPQKYLMEIESISHSQLQLKKLHHNKEFFRDLEECRNVVLDTIKAKIGTIPTEHISDYLERKKLIELERIKKLKHQNELQKINTEKEEQVKRLNDLISNSARLYENRSLGLFGHDSIRWIVWILTILAILILSFLQNYIITWIPVMVASIFMWLRWSKESEINFDLSEKFPRLNKNDLDLKSEKYNNAIRNIINYSNNDDKMKLSQIIKDKNIEEVIALLEDKII